MTKITGWTAALFLAAAGAAWAQCANCGKYHGGAPSSGNLQADADKKSAEIDSMMKRFQEKEAALKREYDNRATARIAEIQAQQQVAQAAIAAAKREEILNRKAADAMEEIVIEEWRSSKRPS